MAKGKGGNTVAAVWEIAKPIAEQLGLDIWDIRFVKEGADWFLRIFIDKEEGVSIEDCENMSRGLGDMLDEVVKYFPESAKEEVEDERPRIAIIGKPNVGKSSLINKLAQEERSIVSNIAGTTRDAIDTEVKYNGKEYVFIDTAGIRRKSKIVEEIERFSIIRAVAAVERCDVAIIMIDATEGGAKIHGTKIMTLKEAIERFCISDFDMDKVIAEMPEMLSEHEKEVFLNHLGNTVIRLEEVRKKAKAGVNHYNKMIQVAKKKTLNTTRYMELYKKVKNVNEFMDTDEMAGFVLSNLEEMQNAILSTINLEEENEHDERVILAKKGKIALETMLPMVDKLIDIANATIMEYKGDDSILYDRYQQGMENWPV